MSDFELILDILLFLVFPVFLLVLLFKQIARNKEEYDELSDRHGEEKRKKAALKKMKKEGDGPFAYDKERKKRKYKRNISGYRFINTNYNYNLSTTIYIRWSNHKNAKLQIWLFRRSASGVC